MSERDQQSGTSTPGFTEADNTTAAVPNPNTIPGSSSSRSTQRRTWDFSAMTPGSPFRRLTTPARRAWKTSPGPLSSQRVSVLSSSVSNHNSPTHDTTRSMPNQHTDTDADDVVSWIDTMKQRAKTIMHAEIEQERKFYEELDRDKRRIQAHHEIDSEAFEKLKIILEGSNQAESQSPSPSPERYDDQGSIEDYESDREYVEDDYAGENFDDGIEILSESEPADEDLYHEDLYLPQPPVIHEVSEVIDLSDDEEDEEEEEDEPHYDPDMFRDEAVSYEVTPQTESMYRRSVPTESESLQVEEGNDSNIQERYDLDSNDEESTYSHSHYSEQEEQYITEAQAESVHNHEDTGNTYQRLQEDQSEGGDYEEGVSEDDNNCGYDHHDEQERYADGAEEYSGIEEAESENDEPDVASIHSMHDLEDDLNLFAGRNFEMLASAALDNAHDYNDLENEDGPTSDSEEVKDHLDTDQHITTEEVHTQDEIIEEDTESITRPIVSGTTFTEYQDQRIQHLLLEEQIIADELIDTISDLSDLHHNEEPGQSSYNEVEIDNTRENEQHIYYDSDNEAYGSPSHSLFGAIRQEDLLAAPSDSESSPDEGINSEEANTDVEAAAEQREMNIHSIGVPSDISHAVSSAPKEDMEESALHSDPDTGEHSFVSFFDNGPAKPDVDPISFADSSHQFVESLKVPPSRENTEAPVAEIETDNSIPHDLHGNVVNATELTETVQVSAEETRSLLEKTTDIAGDITEKEPKETTDLISETMEEERSAGTKDTPPILSEVVENTVSAAEEMEENALGESVDAFTESVEEGIQSGLNEVSSLVSSASQVLEEYETETLGETADEFVQSIKNGLSAVGQSAADAVRAAETFVSAIDGFPDTRQEEELEEVNETVAEEVEQIATEMFETALGESGLDLVTAVEELTEGLPDDTTSKTFLGGEQDDTTAMVTADDIDVTPVEGTSAELELEASTPLKSKLEIQKPQLPGSNLRFSSGVDDIDANNDETTFDQASSHNVPETTDTHIDGTVHNVTEDAVGDEDGDIMLNDDDNNNNDDDVNAGLPGTVSRTAKRILQGMANASNAANEIISETVGAPDETREEGDNYIQDEINSAVQRATGSIVQELTEVSEAANTWCDEAFAAPDDSRFGTEDPNKPPREPSTTGSTDKDDTMTTVPAAAAAAAPPPSLLKRGWNTLRGWTSLKRSKKNPKDYELISQTSNAVKNPQIENITEVSAPQDNPIVDIGGSPVKPSDLDLPPTAATTPTPIENTTTTQRETSMTEPPASKTEEPHSEKGTPKQRKNRGLELAIPAPKHIVMRTRSGRFVGANTDEELLLAMRREEEEERQLSEIVHGDVDAPAFLRDLAIANEFVASREIPGSSGRSISPIEPVTGVELQNSEDTLKKHSTDEHTDDVADENIGLGSDELKVGTESREDTRTNAETQETVGDDAQDFENEESQPEGTSEIGLDPEKKPTTNQFSEAEEGLNLEELEASIKSNKSKRGKKDSNTSRGTRRSTTRRTRASKDNIEDDDDLGNEALDSGSEALDSENAARGRGRERNPQSDVKDGKVSKPTPQTTRSSKSRARKNVPATSRKTRNNQK